MPPLERLGPYLIQYPLGRGGMGTVFLGIDETTGERAAVKVLAPALGADESFRERFGTEIETLKKLTHPNIVQLLGFGEQDGQLFYAMEMVDGQSLQQELQAGRRFDWREAARIGIQICQALKHAHDRGVIHRDLKPANLLHTQDDQIKLADFGIAKLYGMTQLTVAGGVIGTADYMSPEQGDGEPVTARSDLYSLGSVLFTLLAGRPPFASRTAAEVIHKLRYEQPIPVRRLAPDTPEEFELTIAQLLEKDPAQRIATALAVANRLKAMEYGLSLETRAETRSKHFSLSSDEEYQLAGEPDDALTMIARSETRFIHPGERALELEPDAVEPHRNATVAMSSLEAAEGSAPAAQPIHSTHFTTFDDAARQRATSLSAPEESAPLWLKIAPLLAAGALIVYAIWYFSRPLSEEALYGRIMEVARDGESSDLVRVEDRMNEFLTRFPTDDRAREIRALQEELELDRLQRQYERRTRLRGGRDTLGPIERAYVEATQLAAVNPQAAILKLQALLNVFSSGQTSTSDQRCLKLAREQLDQLQARIEVASAADLQALQERLDAADRLASDDPDRAAAIRQGILELYGDKPWAEPVVTRAAAALQK
ncbi:MAG: serine/threonine-protein kinase [Pirellulaceae bacterium]